MSHSVTREAQRAIQSRASLISAAALFYLSGAMDTEAQPATDEHGAHHPAGAARPGADRGAANHRSASAATGAAAGSARAERTEGGCPAPDRFGAGRATPRAAPPAGRAAGTASAASRSTTSDCADRRAGHGGNGRDRRHRRLPRHLAEPDPAADLDPRHAADRQRRHPAGDPGAERRATVRDALRNVAGRHLPRRRGRQPGRHALHPRLLGAERHLPRRRPRSRLVHARRLRGRRGRGLQGAGLRPVRPRLDRRRRQPDQQAAARCATSSKAPSPATPGPACAPRSMPTARSTTISRTRVVVDGPALRHPRPRSCRAEPLRRRRRRC